MILHYCDKCGWRVSPQELGAGAVRLDGDRVLCANCAAKERKPPERPGASARLPARATGSMALPAPPRELHSGKTTTHTRAVQDRTAAHPAPAAPSARRAAQAGPAISPRLMIAGAGVAAVVLAALLVFRGRHEAPAETAKPEVPQPRLDDAKTRSSGLYAPATPPPKPVEEVAKNAPVPGGREETQQLQRKSEDAADDIRSGVAASYLEKARTSFTECPDAVFSYQSKLQDITSRYRDTKPGQEAARLLAELKVPDLQGELSDAAWQQAVNLLPLIDPAKDPVAGQWQLRDGVLAVEPAGMARLEIPYSPPEEYDFRVIFTRLSGNEDVNQLFVLGGRTLMWSMGCEKNKCHGFDQIDGKNARDNSSAVWVEPAVANNQKHTAVVQVRQRVLRAFLDGKMLRELPTARLNYGMRKDWKLRREDILGLGAHQGATAFEKIELREVSGKGKATR